MAAALVLILVFVFDLGAFVLAVAAEQRRSTATLAKDGQMSYCVYDSDISTGFGAGSLFLLLASQILLMVSSRCLCCGRSLSPSGARAWAITLFITSWLAFCIAEVCLLAGSVRNAYHTKYRTYLSSQTPPSCETLRKGVFATGAAFIVLTGITSELYGIAYSMANDSSLPASSGGIGVRMSARH